MSDVMFSDEHLQVLSEKIEAEKVGMFATYDSIEDLVEGLALQGTEVVAVCCAANTAVQIIANKIKDGEIV